jgi:3-phenylpropionate/trans-cinnamate dioxygenase ferredoxin subunit
MDDDRLREGEMSVVFHCGMPVLLVRKSGSVYAVSNKCAHLGCTLSRGTLVGLTVKCPCHDWMFDLRTGEFISASQIKIPAYESKVEGNKIFVNLPVEK